MLLWKEMKGKIGDYDICAGLEVHPLGRRIISVKGLLEVNGHVDLEIHSLKISNSA